MTNLKSKILEYRKKILDAPPARSESVCGKVADQFEDDLLEFDDFPQEYFDFAVSLLDESALYSKQGVWNFLLVLGTEKEKLVDAHKEKLIQVLTSNYKCYADPDLCLAICDFVARNYLPDVATTVLSQLGLIEKSKPDDLRGFANDGLLTVQRERLRSEA